MLDLQVKGLRVVDLPLGLGQTFHSIYIKEHVENKVNKENSKTLFVGNVEYGGISSLDDIKNFLRNLFGVFGDIESFSVSEFKKSTESKHDNKNSRFAHINFLKKSSVKAALNASAQIYHELASNISTQWGCGDCLRKITRKEFFEKNCYKVEDPEKIKMDVFSFMQNFEALENKARVERLQKLAETDEDGFQLVKHRKSSSNVHVAKKSSNRSLNAKPRPRADKKQKELRNFYRFQMKEEKVNKLQSLREKFDQDRQRIAAMKAARGNRSLV